MGVKSRIYSFTIHCTDLSGDEVQMGKAFCQLKGVIMTCGVYPEMLLQLWDQYNERRVSDNERPGTLYCIVTYIKESTCCCHIKNRLILQFLCSLSIFSNNNNSNFSNYSNFIPRFNLLWG